MKPNPIHRLPAPLEAAAQSIKLAAREAVERTIESLGLAALASTHAFQRDGLLAAQFELNRKSAVFVLTFNDAFDERVMREVGGTARESATPAASSWDALSLVENREVELQISAERFGMEIGHACEWELREFNALAATLLGQAGAQTELNPLRPEMVGHAMIRGIEALSDRPDVRKVLSSEISRSLSSLLRSTYADIVATLHHAGVQPRGLSVRGSAARNGPGGAGGGVNTSSPDAPGDAVAGGRAGDTDARWLNRRGESADGMGGRRRTAGGGGAAGPPIGAVDPALMALIRRLANGGGWAGNTGRGAVDSGRPGLYADHQSSAYFGPSGPSGISVWHADAAPLPNLIRVHRDELRQAASGSVDHLVIDVIGSLFDQILSDPRLPPPMARLMARLQLPVLRAALGDPSFFSSRRHPVRRFVNRIASLGAAFDDFNEAPAQRFLAKVRKLVQEVVDGDFEQIDLYEQQLTALEDFIKAQSDLAEQAGGQTSRQAAELLSQKEDEQRLRQLYAERLDGDLKALAGPAFVRDFISQVWSQVLLRASASAGADAVQTQRLRRAGRELFMSVRPLATPAHRKIFLSELPHLMQALTEGMNLIGWPEADRRVFFGQLMPAHAEALKSPAASQLEVNLLSRQVEGALARPLPGAADIKTTTPPRAAVVSTGQIAQAQAEPSFSPQEAQQIGLLDESKVAWDQPVDIDLSDASQAAGLPLVTDVIASFPGLPAPDPAEAAEPMQGRALADHVQIGFAYRMQLQGEWQKVRLAHVSAARGFFVFSHGPRLQQTLSLTRRMLTRLCETGRLLAFENAYLMDRASERARRELAGLS